jgi:hypothetical protein
MAATISALTRNLAVIRRPSALCRGRTHAGVWVTLEAEAERAVDRALISPAFVANEGGDENR